MITQTFDLNMVPESAPVIVKCDQYDIGENRLIASLYNGNVSYTPSAGATAIIQGTKPDKKGFSYSATISGSTVTCDLTEQMTAVAGRTRVNLVITEGGNRTGTFVFWLEVQASALADDVDISETVLPAYISAAQSAARDSEAYAVGKREGVDVGSTDPAYHNNSKYYATEAADSASDASGYATDASGYADDAQGYKNDASGYASDASGYASNALSYRNAAQAAATAAEAWSAHPPYIGQNGNWWIYNTTSQTFVDSGIDASITLEIADVTMLAPGATPYVTNTGTNTDAIFHLFLPRGATGATGNGIQSIVLTSGTHAPGTLDTYTITYTDSTTETIQIYNGQDGTGIGDMTKAVYDSDDTVATDGGIVSYVANAISGKMSYADNGVLGAKNLLPNKATSQTVNGVTFTVNADGSVTINSNGAISGNQYLGFGFFTLPKGSYILNHGHSIESEVHFSLFIETSNNIVIASQRDDESEAEFTINADTVCQGVIRAYDGKTINNMTIYPMIRLASDPDDTYQPYTLTNQELTDNKVDNSVIGTVESGTTTSKAYSVNDLFIKDGKLYKVTASIAQGANITVGTNCVQTSVNDILTALLSA